MFKLSLVLIAISVYCVNCELGLAGGKSDVDLSNKDTYNEYASLATFATQMYTNQLNSKLTGTSKVNFQQIKLERAQAQVVAGVKTYLTVVIHDINCIQNCPDKTCTFTVFEQSWTNTKELSDASCN